MNKALCIGFIMLFCGQFAFSQKSEFKPELAFGINGGTTFSNVSFITNNSYKYTTGDGTEATTSDLPQRMLQQYTGGITIRYISEKYIGLQAELNYSLRGWEEKADTNLTFPDHKYARSLAYIELPVATHFYINMGKRVRTIFNLGPQISYFLSDKVLENNIHIREDRKDYKPVYYDMPIKHKFDWGIFMGGGFEFRTGAGSFILEGRYYLGLSDIFDSSRQDPYQRSSNQVLNVKLAYLYRLK